MSGQERFYGRTIGELVQEYRRGESPQDLIWISKTFAEVLGPQETELYERRVLGVKPSFEGFSPQLFIFKALPIPDIYHSAAFTEDARLKENELVVRIAQKLEETIEEMGADLGGEIETYFSQERICEELEKVGLQTLAAFVYAKNAKAEEIFLVCFPSMLGPQGFFVAVDLLKGITPTRVTKN